MSNSSSHTGWALTRDKVVVHSYPGDAGKDTVQSLAWRQAELVIDHRCKLLDWYEAKVDHDAQIHARHLHMVHCISLGTLTASLHELLHCLDKRCDVFYRQPTSWQTSGLTQGRLQSHQDADADNQHMHLEPIAVAKTYLANALWLRQVFHRRKNCCLTGQARVYSSASMSPGTITPLACMWCLDGLQDFRPLHQSLRCCLQMYGGVTRSTRWDSVLGADKENAPQLADCIWQLQHMQPGVSSGKQ